MAWFSSNSSTITKLEEGFDGPSDQDIPIDIHSQKLLEFLVDRKKVPTGWKNNQTKVKTKVSKIFKELKKYNPPPKIANILDHEVFTFWDMQEVEEWGSGEVSNTDNTRTKGQQNQFTQQVTQLRESITLIQQDNIHLADAASALNFWVSYDIPALRKGGDKFEKQISEIHKKITEQTKQFHHYEERFATECKQWGIQGKNIRDELSKLTLELPGHFKEIEKLIRSEEMGDLIRYYRSFVQSNLQFDSPASTPAPAPTPSAKSNKKKKDNKSTSSPSPSPSSAEGKKDEERCAMIYYVYEHGNHSVAQRNHFLDPEHNPAPSELFKDDVHLDEKPISIDIDWDIPIDITKSEKKDLGNHNQKDNKKDNQKKNTKKGIQSSGWEIVVEDKGENTSTDNNNNWNITPEAVADISFDIDFGDLLPSQPSSSSSSVQSKGAKKRDREEEIAKLKQARLKESLLENLETRSLILNDLFELSSFYQIRSLELNGSAAILLLESMMKRNEKVTLDSKRCEQYSTLLQNILSHLSEGRVKQLLEIKTSEKYLDRISADLRRRYELKSKMKESLEEMEARRDELEKSRQTSFPQLHQTILRAKELQGHLQSSLSKLYNGRIVNLIGEINTL